MNAPAPRQTNTSKALVKDDQEPAVVTLMKQFKTQIAQSLPKHLNNDRVTRIVLNEFRRNPALLECEPFSVIGSIVQSAQLGLEIGSGLGHAYLVPYGKECQFIPGYKGLADLTRRTGKIKGIWSEVVLTGDYFFHGFKMGRPILDFTPNDDVDRADETLITHAFCVAEFDNGSFVWEVMSRSEIERVKSKRKNKYDGVWKEHYAEMCKKTVLRRAVKKLPMSPELVDALEADNANHDGKAQNNHRILAEQGILEANFERVDQNDKTDAPPSAAEQNAVKHEKAQASAGPRAALDFQMKRIKDKWGIDCLTLLNIKQDRLAAASPVALQGYADFLKQWADKEENPA